MPLHRLFVPPNFYSDADKEAIADAITKCYPMLPPFYVVVLFIDVEKKNYFVGGEHRVDFVRFCIEHIARQFTKYVLLLIWHYLGLIISILSQ